MKAKKFSVVCFIDDGFDSVVSRHRSKEAAKRSAARFRKENGDRLVRYFVTRETVNDPFSLNLGGRTTKRPLRSYSTSTLRRLWQQAETDRNFSRGDSIRRIIDARRRAGTSL